MAKMRAVDTAAHVLERAGVTATFGVPSAAINPLYAAIRPRNTIQHVLTRHVQGAAHMAEDHSGLVSALEIVAGGHEVRRSGDTGDLLA